MDRKGWKWQKLEELIENWWKSMKIGGNGQKGLDMERRTETGEMDRYGLKWKETCGNGQKGVKMGGNGSRSQLFSLFLVYDDAGLRVP